MITNNKKELTPLSGVYDACKNNKKSFLFTLSNKDIDYSKDTPSHDAYSFIGYNCCREVNNSVEIAIKYINFLKEACLNPDKYNYDKVISPFRKPIIILNEWEEIFKDDNEELSLEDLKELFNNLFKIYYSNNYIDFGEKNVCGLAFLLNNFKNNKDDAKKYLLMDSNKKDSNFKFYLFIASLYYGATYSLDELKSITNNIVYNQINFELIFNNRSYKNIFHKVINNLFDVICEAMVDTNYLLTNEIFFEKVIDFCATSENRRIDSTLINSKNKLLNKIIALHYFNSGKFIIALSQNKLINELYSLIKEKGGYKHTINELDNDELKKFISSRKKYKFSEKYVKRIILNYLNSELNNNILLIPILLLSINNTNKLNSNKRLFSKKLEALTIKLIASTSLEDIKMIFKDVPNNNVLIEIKELLIKYNISDNKLYDLINCLLDEDLFPQKEFEDIYYDIYRYLPKLNKFYASLYRINNKL